MKCPRCETTMLDERDRDGVTVDVCTQCRGLWLDRGELEKLIARAARDLDELEQSARAPAREAPRAPAYEPAQQHRDPSPRYPAQDAHYGRSRRDSDPPYRDPHHRDPYRRKKSFIEQLGDIFD